MSPYANMDARQMDFRSVSNQVKGTLLFEIGLFSFSLLAASLLIFKFVLPQLETWSVMNQEAQVTRQHIATINDNIAYLQTLQDSDVEEGLKTAGAALPTDPDFSGAMQAILASSINSGVQLDQFNFSVGTVATKSAQTSKDLKSMDIRISVKGDGKAVKDFIASMYEYLPLSSITTALSGTSGEASTEIALSFPSKPLPDAPFLKTEPIPKDSKVQQQTLQTLKEWQAKALVLTDDDASTSANLPPPF